MKRRNEIKSLANSTWFDLRLVYKTAKERGYNSSDLYHLREDIVKCLDDIHEGVLEFLDEK